MSELEEVSRAAAAVSKFGTKALDVTEKIGTFIGKVFNEPLESAVGMLGDKLKYLRWQRQVRMVDEASEFLASRNITNTRPVPPKLALPILQNGSLEEVDELQNLWIKLLVNAMDPQFNVELRYAFIEIIKSLSPIDVKILDFFYKVLAKESKINQEVITNFSLTKEQICEKFKINSQDYFVSVYNLFRVQCLAPAILKGGIRVGKEPMTIFKGADAVTLTPLGKNFVEACIKND